MVPGVRPAFPRPHEVGERWRAKRDGEGAICDGPWRDSLLRCVQALDLPGAGIFLSCFSPRFPPPGHNPPVPLVGTPLATVNVRGGNGASAVMLTWHCGWGGSAIRPPWGHYDPCVWR